LYQSDMMRCESMIETALIVGLMAVTIPVLIYNTRAIAEVKSKVDALYENLNIKFRFKDNNHK